MLADAAAAAVLALAALPPVRALELVTPACLFAAGAPAYLLVASPSPSYPSPPPPLTTPLSSPGSVLERLTHLPVEVHAALHACLTGLRRDPKMPFFGNLRKGS